MGNLLQNALALVGAAGANSTTIGLPIAIIPSLGSASSIPNQGTAGSAFDCSLVNTPTWAATGGPLYSANYVASASGSAIGDGGSLTVAATGSKRGRIPSIEAYLDLLDADGLTVVMVHKRGAYTTAYGNLIGARNAAGNRGFIIAQDTEIAPGFRVVNGSQAVSVYGASGEVNNTYAVTDRGDGLWGASGNIWLLETWFLHETRSRMWRRIDAALQGVTASSGTSAGALTATGTSDLAIGGRYDGTTWADGVNGQVAFFALLTGEITAAQNVTLKQGAYRNHRGAAKIRNLWDLTNITKHSGSQATVEGDRVEVLNDVIGSEGLTNSTEAEQPSLIIGSNVGRRALQFLNRYFSSSLGGQTQSFAGSLLPGIKGGHHAMYVALRLNPYIRFVSGGDEEIVSLSTGANRSTGIACVSNQIQGLRVNTVYKPATWYAAIATPSLAVVGISVGENSAGAGSGAGILRARLWMNGKKGDIQLSSGIGSLAEIDGISLCGIQDAWVEEVGVFSAPIADSEIDAIVASVFAEHSGESASPTTRCVLEKTSIGCGHIAGAAGSLFTPTPLDDDPLGLLGFPYPFHLVNTTARRASWTHVGAAGWNLKKAGAGNDLLDSGTNVGDLLYWDATSGVLNIAVVEACVNDLNEEAAAQVLLDLEDVLAGQNAECDKRIVIQASSNGLNYATYNAGLAAWSGTRIDAIGNMNGAFGAGELSADNLHPFGGSYAAGTGHGRYAKAILNALITVAPSTFRTGGVARFRGRGRVIRR